MAETANCSSNIIWFATVDIGRLAFSYASSQGMHSNVSSDFEWDCCVCSWVSALSSSSSSQALYIILVYPVFFIATRTTPNEFDYRLCTQSQFLWYLPLLVVVGVVVAIIFLCSCFAHKECKSIIFDANSSLCACVCVCVSAYLTQAIHLAHPKLSINARNECERGKKKTQTNKQNKSFFKLVLTRQI